jgi:hypothetical protein
MLAVVLFTDIVSATEQTAQLDGRRWLAAGSRSHRPAARTRAEALTVAGQQRDAKTEGDPAPLLAGDRARSRRSKHPSCCDGCQAEQDCRAVAVASTRLDLLRCRSPVAGPTIAAYLDGAELARSTRRTTACRFATWPASLAPRGRWASYATDAEAVAWFQTAHGASMPASRPG